MKETWPKIEQNQSSSSIEKLIFNQYIKRLQLSPEDFDKNILDIGSGSAQFAKYAKEHNLSSSIVSLDPQEKLIRRAPAAVIAKAEDLPFKDNTFDLVISAHAIPILLTPKIDDPYDWYIFEEHLRNILQEMLRVTKYGGEIRISPIIEGRVKKIDALMRKSVDKVIAALIREGGIIADEISVDEIKYAGQDKKDIVYLIKIKKLK